MKSLTLHLRLAICILSLLLAAALLPMWYRSHQGPDFLRYASPNHWYFSLTSGHGTVDVLYIAHWPGEPEFHTGRRDKHVFYGTRYGNRFLGFGSAAQTNGGRFVVIPYWFLVACCFLTATLSAHSWHRRRRALLEGRCKQCGYDLRATSPPLPRMRRRRLKLFTFTFPPRTATILRSQPCPTRPRPNPATSSSAASASPAASSPSCSTITPAPTRSSS